MQTVQKGLLANPPLGTRPQGSVEVAVNRPEFVKTSDNQVIFLRHIMSIVKRGGRVGVVLPDSVLTDMGATEKVREKLLGAAQEQQSLPLSDQPKKVKFAKSITEVQWILDMLVLKAFVYQSDDI